MAADGRFGGHVVQGHVDGTAPILAASPGTAGRSSPSRCRPSWPATSSRRARSRSTASRSPCRAVDATARSGLADPHHARPDDARPKGVGDPVNLEVDVIAKYVERLLTPGAAAAAPPAPAEHTA